MDEDEAKVGRSWSRRRLAAFGVLLLLVLAALATWTQRRQIAADFIDRELARRGVQATYEVKRISLRTQRLENVVIGDPRRPDATARWIEVDLALGVRSPRVTMIRARGVRLRGAIVEGALTMGQIDRLLPPPSGRPFRLPNQRIDIADAAMRLETPAGVVGLGIEGSGNLAYSFEGRLAAASHRLTPGNCRIEAARASFRVTTKDEQPRLRGPVTARSARCSNVVASAPRLVLDATLEPALDGWQGHSALEIAALQAGEQRFAGLRGKIDFEGDSDWTRGDVDVAAAGIDLDFLRAGRTRAEGRYAFSARTGNLSLLADFQSSGVDGAETLLAPVSDALGAADGTPVEPIAAVLAASLRSAAQSFNAAGTLRYVDGSGWGAARLERFVLASRSGARLAHAGGEGVSLYWPSGLTRLDGEFALTGGGLPAVRLSLDQPRGSGAMRGTARIAPMRANGARLAFAPVRFEAAAGGITRINTVATLDGPIPNGRVSGLVVPINGRFGADGYAFGSSCTQVRFQSLRSGSLALGPTRLPLCPAGRAILWAEGGRMSGGAVVRPLRLSGRLGGSPLALAAGRVLLEMTGPAFTASEVELRLGEGESASRLRLAGWSGRFGAGGVAGRFSGGSGKLAAVPLLLSDASGAWRVRGSELEVDGALTVSDEADPSRFHPLISDDFRLRMAGDLITAAGWLKDPETGTRITEVAIRHDLARGSGNALLDVPGITFTETFQPEALTRLTTGVVALLRGTVTGSGEISWSPEGTSSTGSFTTQDMDLAANFGPIEGLSTTIRFTDLLGLETAPGQVANVDLIRTGIDVVDGSIRYQLLPDLRVRVEEGRWPFAGGELILEETLLDFSKPSPKHLTFRVVGLDAAIFVQRMEFSNIAATGTFDGVIPMIFDERGGRIVGGHLEAREGGGTLSYVGELTDRDLGIYGKLAFDALKSLRYDRLVIDLNGSLDGEFIAGIELDGIARDPALTSVSGGGLSGMIARRALGQLARIPFEFNIVVRGPFRSLIATARSFEDPSALIESVLPEMLQDQPTIVQPEESEIVQ